MNSLLAIFFYQNEVVKVKVYRELSNIAPAWIPYLVEDVLALERVQQRASLSLLSGKNVVRWNYYKDCLRKLKWPTLETCRFFLSLVECYKIV